MAMLKNYLKSAFRNILRKKTGSWINILGLTLGLSITLLIWMYVFYERSYDRFFEDHQHIFRVHNTVDFMGETFAFPTCMFTFGETALQRYPEVEQMTRFNPQYIQNPWLRLEETVVNTKIIAAADSTFFQVFPMKFLAGKPADALAVPNALVLTNSLAKSLFEQPLLGMHQNIELNGKHYQVTAIIEDLPENSHLAFNGLTSSMDVPANIKKGGFSFYTYLKLASGADLAKLEGSFSELAGEILAGSGFPSEEPIPVHASLIKLSDIHLTSNQFFEIKPGGSMRNIMIFSTMSVFILLLALINYVNLATARSSMRAREIGLRKVAGSTRGSLIRQFMTESFLITVMAFIVALVLAEIFAGFFFSYLGQPSRFAEILSGQGLMALLALLIITGVLAGFYPAFYLSAFQPVKTLKGDMVKGNKGRFFRRLLVVFQFAITIFLISSFLVYASQLKFMTNQSLGYDKESVLIARNLAAPLRRNHADIVARLEALEGVRQVAGADFIFGEKNRMDNISLQGSASAGITADILSVDEKFIPMMGINIQQGRNFLAHSELDVRESFLLNQAAVQALDIQDISSARINWSGRTGSVIGVVEDFQLLSLQNPIGPMLIAYSTRSFPQLYLKLTPGNISHIRMDVEKVFREFDNTWYPDLVFLDEKLEAQYSAEKQTSSLLKAGSVLSIIISLLGVYGLAAFSIERRVKEIGIRKIMGASTRNLIWIFNKEFIILLLVAFVIAAPLAWWALETWLTNFVMRISLNPLFFLIPVAFSCLLTSYIINLQVWKVSKANPINSLRFE